MPDKHKPKQAARKKRRVVKKKVTPKTAWKPGQSGNPKGRPPGQTATERIREALFSQLGEEKDKTKLDYLVQVAMQKARDGDFRYFKYLIDRIDGRPAESIKLEHNLPQNIMDLILGDMKNDEE